jgi:hypothetical protein
VRAGLDALFRGHDERGQSIGRLVLPSPGGLEAAGNIRLIVEHRENNRGRGAAIGEPISAGTHPGITRPGKLGIGPGRRQALARRDPALCLADRGREVCARLEPPEAL